MKAKMLKSLANMFQVEKLTKVHKAIVLNILNNCIKLQKPLNFGKSWTKERRKVYLKSANQMNKKF